MDLYKILDEAGLSEELCKKSKKLKLIRIILIDKYNVKSTKHCSRKPLRQQKMQGGVLIILFSSKTEMKPNKEGWAKKENRK